MEQRKNDFHDFPPRIALLGMMGSGKSTWGKRLAKAVGFDFIDLDYWIENQVGRSISAIFETEGEDAFRRYESNFLSQLLEKENLVLSTGGGTPCNNSNLYVLKGRSFTIYLELPVGAIVSRLAQDEHRPLLKGIAPHEMNPFIMELLEKRVSYYQQADITVPALDLKLEMLLHQIRNAAI